MGNIQGKFFIEDRHRSCGALIVRLAGVCPPRWKIVSATRGAEVDDFEELPSEVSAVERNAEDVLVKHSK